MSNIKAGDTVKIHQNDYSSMFLTGGHYPVARVNWDGDVWLLGKDGDEYLFCSYEVEKVEAPAGFKVGDRVRVIDGYGPPKGTLGTVYETELLDVVLDDWFAGHDGEAYDGSTNHWYFTESRLEKVEEPASEPSVMDDLGGDFEGDFRTPGTCKMWIVAVLDSAGNPRPNNKARTYTSAEQARRVSREMAERHKGEIFVVFEAVGAAAHPRNPTLYADL
jgi:hypothetical protein